MDTRASQASKMATGHPRVPLPNLTWAWEDRTWLAMELNSKVVTERLHLGPVDHRRMESRRRLSGTYDPGERLYRLCRTSLLQRSWRLTLHRMGELEPWIDENFVRSVWYNMGEQVNVKMIRDKFSG